MMLRFFLFAFVFAAAPVAAQSVADYYHTAAQAYIGGDNAEAEQAAVAGLALAPNDAKLQALLEKIRERNPDDSGGEQEQDEAEQQQDGEGEQQDDAQSGEQEQEQESDESDGEQQNEEQQPESQQQPEDPSEQEPTDQQQGDAGTEGEQEPTNPQGGGDTATPFDVKPGEMSRDEAERILRAVESDELELLRDVQRRRARPRYVEKDW